MNVTEHDTPNMFTLAYMIEAARDNITAPNYRINGRLAFFVCTDGAPDDYGEQLVTVVCTRWYADALELVLREFAPNYRTVGPHTYQFMA